MMPSLYVLLLIAAAPSAAPMDCPVRVDQAKPGFEAVKAGIRGGDCVLAWRRGDATGALADPLQLLLLEFEQAPRGGLELEILQSEQRRWVPMASGNWGVQSLPALSVQREAGLRDWIEDYEAGSAGDWPTPAEQDPPATRAALTLRLASTVMTRDAQRADAIVADAIAADWAGGDARMRALLQLSRCTQSLQGLLLDRVGEHCRTAQLALQAADLPVAALRARLAWIAGQRQRGDIEAASRALAVLQADVDALVPNALLAVSLMQERASLLRLQERLDEALAQLQQGLAMLQRLGSADRLRLAFTSTLGLIQRARGEHDAAEAALLAAAAISERIGPDSIQLARDLNNLALIQWDRMNMAQAQATLDRSLDIKRRRGATLADLGATLGNLALIAMPLGRLDAAETYLNEALAIYRQGEPTLLLANTLTSAGRVAEDRGNRNAACRNYDEALSIYRRLAPDSSLQAWAHHFKAGALSDDGRLEEALGEAGIAVALQRRISPGGRDLSFGLSRLAGLQRDQGQLDAAAAHFDEAIALRRKHSPGSQTLAQSLHGAGTVASARGKRDLARQHYCEAVTILEQQRLRWSQTRDDLIELGRSNHEVYRACAVAWLDLQNPEAAFDILEQSRARLLLDSMARHRAELIAALPASVADAWRSMQQDAATLESADLTLRQRALQQVAEDQAPGSAALLLARPRSWSELRTRLRSDSVILSHLQHQQRFWIVLARRGQAPPMFIPVTAAADEIVARAQRFARMARTPAGDLDSLDAEGRWLYRQLVEPAAQYLGDATSLLWVPDGALTLLPLGALVAGDGRYLIETHALRQAASLSSAAAGYARQRPAATIELLAVANPASATLSDSSLARWRAVGATSHLPPLPGATAEARSIVGLYGSGASALIGAHATERAVREQAPRARRLHFAVHGLIDPLRPLDSALVLAPGRGDAADDGLLLASDLLTGPPLAADLVAVSACDLGGGRVYPGEGLIGLRHALSAAGAREVVSSLWPVGDLAGASLMTRFHREAHAGSASDRALQIAQVAMLKDRNVRDRTVRGVGGLVAQGRIPGKVHPFYWAGFVLDGVLD
jgi:CHAT domain-containing protein